MNEVGKGSVLDDQELRYLRRYLPETITAVDAGSSVDVWSLIATEVSVVQLIRNATIVDELAAGPIDLDELTRRVSRRMADAGIRRLDVDPVDVAGVIRRFWNGGVVAALDHVGDGDLEAAENGLPRRCWPSVVERCHRMMTMAQAGALVASGHQLMLPTVEDTPRLDLRVMTRYLAAAAELRDVVTALADPVDDLTATGSMRDLVIALTRVRGLASKVNRLVNELNQATMDMRADPPERLGS